jgi:REP element-mobilizing transposase RayT
VAAGGPRGPPAGPWYSRVVEEEDWRQYRRDLPHWRASGATYFVTWRVRRGLPDLTPTERTIVVQALNHFHGSHYDLFAWVVMNDHVHVLVTPRPRRRLEDIIQSRKSFTSHAFSTTGRKAGVWLSEYFDRIIRDAGEFEEKLKYIFENPGRRWPSIVEYPWVGANAVQ